ncbi:MAG: hypothetical protein ACRELB_17105, partial [Polyangiaceae bacterium]
SQTCPLSLGFVGAYAVAVYCPAAGDAGAGAVDAGVTPATIMSFTGTGLATSATLTTAANTGFAGDKAGAHILFGTAAGLQVASLAAGTASTIDAAGTTGAFTSDGNHVIYLTTGGGISTAATTGSPSPTTLVASGGFTGLLGLSPNDAYVLVYKSQTTTAAGDTVNDEYVASTTTPGNATALSAGVTSALYGDPFTADSTHVMYDQNVSGGTGDFTTQAVSGTAAATQGPTNWIWSSTSAGKALFNANYAQGGNQGGTADLLAVDTAGSGAPTLLVTQADAFYYLTAAKDKVVYSWSYLPNSWSGIWVLPVP